ncbi:MAG: hypothetical protein LWX55_16635 [Deltaproteobacteria bacterium]|jgi:hypothetical protein|nr:hypothetical protein [Deltaproteobacteria bacterium]
MNENLKYMIIGVLIPYLIQLSINLLKFYKKVTIIKKRKLQSDTASIFNWIINYYNSRGRNDDLYQCHISEKQKTIPFLVLPSNRPTPLDFDLNKNFDFIKFESINVNFPVEKKLIEERKNSGMIIYPDSPSVFIDSIIETPNSTAFSIKTCQYFSILSNVISIENETFTNIQRKNKNNTNVRDSYLASIEQAIMFNKKPLSLGCSFLIAMKTESSYDFIFHKRSSNMLTYPNIMSSIPNFGINPIPARSIRSKNMTYNLVLYNFIKEYLEELYDYEELIDNSKNKRIDPFWFYDADESQLLISAGKSGKLKLYYLGFGFDCLNGVPTLSFLCTIQDQQVINDLITNGKLNYESDINYGLEKIPIGSDKLIRWLREDMFLPVTAFAISETLRNRDTLLKD